MIRALALAVLFALISCSGGETPPPTEQAELATTIEAADLLQRIQKENAPLILDVRRADEYENGHVPGAQLIPHDELPNRLLELAAFRHEELVVYCHSGRRAGIAEAALKEAGFTNVVHLNGDWSGWSAAGYPAATPVAP